MADTVLAVASGKGGVGKTTTTVNLGTALATAGHRTVVVDADMGMANLAGFVSLGTDDATLHEVLAGDAPVKEATYRLTEGLFAVPSAPQLERYSQTDTEGLAVVVDTLQQAFDYVLLDVGAGVSHETVLPLGLADGVVLVSTPDPAAVQDTEKTLDLVGRAGGTVRGLVLTRVRSDHGTEIERIVDRVGHPLLAAIPEDDAVRESVSAGRPVVVHAPDGPAAEAYEELARTLVEGRDGQADAADAATDGAGRDGDETGDGEEAGSDDVSEALSDLEDGD
jgi:septum site-determining protein MinD